MIEGKRRRIAGYSDEIEEIKKGPWKAEEDEVLMNHVKKYGPRDWSSIRSKGLLRRTGKSCRLRWVNKLRPNLKNGVKFSAEEERTVIDLQAQFGNKWARIATYLPGRTDNDVKNFWSSRQKRLARILLTSSVPSSSKPPKIIKEAEASVFHDVPFVEASKFSSSTEDQESTTKSCSSSHVSNPEPIKMVPLPEILYTSLHNYEHCPFQPDYTPAEKKPFPERQPHLSFPPIPLLQSDFPLPLESQEFVTRLGDPNFLDVFGNSNESALGTAQLPIGSSFFGPDRSCEIGGRGESHDEVTPDSFIDDFPPIDMFDHIEPLPSPSEWS
ncbi:hypothetical protein BUALT_Bualt01G0199300 [Buddleja alternifolia]|uniref:Uncharacterized protein n=1 Tax=Buddleja alternifolia TaxID=168488 RepID=A0AAV6YCS4_9LAMI|nr:hypothetical protein BUALT_Bualt01G0199300 [Buddleja alternifolia]